MLIPILCALDPETPLRDYLHPLDRYNLDMALEDMGKKAPWQVILSWETAGQVQEWVR